jgi:hypothetical protein
VADKITYFAIIDDSSSREHPAGVLRRIEYEKGKVDEVFSRDLEWAPSPLLRTAEHGDLTNDFVEITEEEAARITERIRTESGEGVLRRGLARR